MESEGKMKEEDGIESKIEDSMRSRLLHFREQADCLTFEGVRRLLEKDLELQPYALDVHKKFIKQLLQKCLNDADDGSVCNTTGVKVEENVSLTKIEEAESPEKHQAKNTKIEEAESPEKHQAKNDVKEQVSGDEEKTEDSPVMGLLTEDKLTKSVQTQDIKKNEVPSESTIKKAIWKRASYFIANSEKITMAGVRRFLEKDLELEKNILDPFKKFISKQLDEVLNSPEVPKSASSGKKRSSENKTSKTISADGSESSDGGSDAIESEVKSRKKVSPKGKPKKFEGIRKRKRPENETKLSSKKQIKRANAASEENSDAEDGGNIWKDNQSQSSTEKPVKKKEVSAATASGKHVERLKSIIKSCGMIVAPSIYKKAKQVSDNKREAFIIKELEVILSREGLSTNPTEKEIKDVKKKKQREKELEGIDMSNIVSSSRRRSTSSFVAPPKPKSPVKCDREDAGTNNDDGNEDDDNDDDDDDDDDNDGDDSRSEEFNEDADDSD